MKALSYVTCAMAFVLAGAPALAKSREPVKVTSASSLKGVQKVTIGQVTVAFLVERKDSAKAGGGLTGNGFGGRSTTRSTLQGVSQADLQAIASSAYVDLEARLKVAGFELVDRGTYQAHPALAKAKPLAQPYEMSVVTGRDDKAKVVYISAPQTAPLRMFTGDAVVTGFAAMGLVMSGSQSMMAASEFAKATGVHVVNGIYYVDFADSDEYGGWFRSSSAVTVKASLALLPDQSKLSVIGPNYKTGAIVLSDPVAVGGDFFHSADTTSGGARAEQAVANVIGLIGGVGTNSSKQLTFTAKPGTYVPGASRAVAEANEVLVAKLAALR